MVNTSQLICPMCQGSQLALMYEYSNPPKGEVQYKFNSSGNYYRKIVECQDCRHMVSFHNMDMSNLYDNEYVQSVYGNGKLEKAFNRIISLDPDSSDNHGRVEQFLRFTEDHFKALDNEKEPRSILDVGSGLCVFLYKMRQVGWHCLALDPDKRNVEHALNTVGVDAVCGDFFTIEGLERFDAISFNKVLEHVADPVRMLKKGGGLLNENGFVYVEVPDGEAAKVDGRQREEFYIDHLHVFSAESLTLMAHKAGLKVKAVEALQEPSSKYTLRAFLTH